MNSTMTKGRVGSNTLRVGTKVMTLKTVKSLREGVAGNATKTNAANNTNNPSGLHDEMSIFDESGWKAFVTHSKPHGDTGSNHDHDDFEAFEYDPNGDNVFDDGDDGSSSSSGSSSMSSDDLSSFGGSDYDDVDENDDIVENLDYFDADAGNGGGNGAGGHKKTRRGSAFSLLGSETGSDNGKGNEKHGTGSGMNERRGSIDEHHPHHHHHHHHHHHSNQTVSIEDYSVLYCNRARLLFVQRLLNTIDIWLPSLHRFVLLLASSDPFGLNLEQDGIGIGIGLGLGINNTNNNTVSSSLLYNRMGQTQSVANSRETPATIRRKAQYFRDGQLFARQIGNILYNCADISRMIIMGLPDTIDDRGELTNPLSPGNVHLHTNTLASHQLALPSISIISDMMNGDNITRSVLTHVIFQEALEGVFFIKCIGDVAELYEGLDYLIAGITGGNGSSGGDGGFGSMAKSFGAPKQHSMKAEDTVR